MPMARRPVASVFSAADAASWYVALVLGALVLASSLREGGSAEATVQLDEPAGGGRLVARPCDEIYVVGEGETLHSISDKCGDPFIVERNPHIHDPDDVFPGLVILITPSKPPV
ncbi:uncharacterized protein LOC121992880 [Zingiber officinale]|uniref:LysM domain-containing protein n=1 Tax=Zingiber officinale TaxID=94328 RepID=A0A8J5FWR3_ZINOF|nr:uncharacterized protein LOC121992880 [Zingiber officinale]KAG6496320.1 hypothetical protein ZIOFF_044181 [Zingiber officinale]